MTNILASAAVFIMTALVTASVTEPCLASTYDYKLDQGRRLPVSILKTSATSEWLVYLQGSGCEFAPVQTNRFMQMLLSKRDYNVLVIGKAGADLGGDVNLCRTDEFQRSSVRSIRIADIHTIMNDLIPAQARILLSALSEGAYIAPDVAVEDPRVKAYIDISGNTESYITEELMCTPAGPERDKLQALFDNEIRGNNSFTKYYQDWTYGYLNSYDTNQSYESMKALKIPILWMNAENDDVLWIDGARQAAQRLIQNEGKTNIQYEWILGGGHTLHCSPTSTNCDEAALAAHVSDLMTTFAAKHF